MDASYGLKVKSLTTCGRCPHFVVFNSNFFFSESFVFLPSSKFPKEKKKEGFGWQFFLQYCGHQPWPYRCKILIVAVLTFGTAHDITRCYLQFTPAVLCSVVQIFNLDYFKIMESVLFLASVWKMNKKLSFLTLKQKILDSWHENSSIWRGSINAFYPLHC